MDENIDDKTYYQELHNTLRHYDTKLWTALGLFIVVVGWLITQLDYEDFWDWRNCVIFLSGGTVSFLLLSKFIKEHSRTLWIQKKINKFDERQNSGKDKYLSLLAWQPLHSIPGTKKSIKKNKEGQREFSEEDMILSLKIEFEEDPYFNMIPGHEWLIKRRVSGFIVLLMSVVFVAGLCLGLIGIWLKLVQVFTAFPTDFLVLC